MKGYAASSGRKIKEDGTVINIADTLEEIANSMGVVAGNETHYKLKTDPFPSTNIKEKDYCIEVGDAGVEKVYIYLKSQWRDM